MQDTLFAHDALPEPRGSAGKVLPAAVSTPLRELAAALPAEIYLGNSSWSYPGWAGIVWAGKHSESQLAKQGLTAYSQHPLLRQRPRSSVASFQAILF